MMVQRAALHLSGDISDRHTKPRLHLPVFDVSPTRPELDCTQARGEVQQRCVSGANASERFCCEGLQCFELLDHVRNTWNKVQEKHKEGCLMPGPQVAKTGAKKRNHESRANRTSTFIYLFICFCKEAKWFLLKAQC